MVNHFSAKELYVATNLILGKTARIWTKLKDGSIKKLSRRGVLTLVNTNTVQAITDATYTLTEEDNGKTFGLARAAGIAVTIPTFANGANIEVDFVVLIAPAGGAYTIVTSGSENSMNGPIVNMAGGAGTSAANSDTITFVASQAVVGDRVKIKNMGITWAIEGLCKVAAGLTATQAT